MTIVAGLFVAIFGRLLGHWKGALAALLGILFYTLLVGPSASVVRAALMGGLAIFARPIGRRQQGLNSLALVAALMAVFTPLVLWDVGFQLTFAATLGLILYAEPLSAWFTSWISNLRLPLSVCRAGWASFSCSPWRRK